VSEQRRLASVDLLRGAVMVLMAIDHVRVYAGVPPGGPEVAVFFTRWVTNFCAPVFVFLAGTSIFLAARATREQSRLLVTRGLWLVLLELTLIHLAWTFNPAHTTQQMAGVIWAIGWCMVLMALLVRLPLKVVGAIGIAIIAGHNLIPAPVGDSVSPLLSILYYGMARGPIDLGGGWSFSVLYSIVPWIGVMAAGFGFGRVLRFEPARRDRVCLALGLGAIAAFIVLRAFDLYGDPNSFRTGQGAVSSLLSFLQATKYPASLQFLLMTLGPAIALIPLLERARGALARAISVFGRVPFFYYLLHIPLIHALALVVSLIHGGVNPWLFDNHPMDPGPVPEGYRWSLPLLYLVFAIAVALLYWPCRWFADLKSRRRDWWLTYM